jgi:hypothetical protein
LSIATAPPRTVDEDGVWGAITTTGDPASLNPSEIVDTWVYKDGWMGKATLNEECTSPTAAGCNGHRRAILRAPPKPGAKLMIDVYAASLPIDGAHGLSIAAVLNWTAP